MKKTLSLGILFFVFICTIRADDLADLLQDLAVQTACLGMYSTAQTGVYVTSRYDDPPDWYDPHMMANRFVAMSGAMTRTITFYGICFDYAQFAWNDIAEYRADYNRAGMKGQQWYIAAADRGDPYTIILYDPVSKEQATTIRNGVYLKENARHKIYSHDGAEGHAWLWVQHNDGTWYWIDPTWTDNTGYVWWGKVENGREIQYYPDPDYCVASNFPRPGVANSGTRSSSSSYTTPPNTGGTGYGATGYCLGYAHPFDFDFDFRKNGFFFSIEEQYLDGFSFFDFTIDYLMSWTEETTDNQKKEFWKTSLLLGTALGYPLFDVITLYVGGGLGIKLDDFGDFNSIEFAWKVNGGIRLQFGSFFVKFDTSYGTIIGPALGVGLGLFV